MKDHVFFCPACGSPSIETSELAGGVASCTPCSWKGSREDLVQVPLEHSFSSQEEMLTRFITQVASTIAKTGAVEIGRVLLQWGFLDEKNIQEELQSYIRSMAVAAAKSVIETRQHLEVARANRVRSHDVS